MPLKKKIPGIGSMVVLLLFFIHHAHAQQAEKADSLFQAGNWKAAMTEYTALAKKDAKSALYQTRLGRCKVKLNDYDGAIPHYREAIRIGNNATVMLFLADAFALKSMADSSLNWLEKSVNGGLQQYGLFKSSETARLYAINERFKKIALAARKTFEPCTVQPESRQFDFWIGEWNVFKTSDNTPAGSSSIQLILNSCVIFENWTNSGGGQGKSFNIYDTLARQWVQTWVDDHGNQTIYKGNLKNGSMVVTTDRQQQPDGSWQLHRMTFTPNSDGSVRQFGEGSNDDGKNWFTEFDLLYRKKSP